MTLHRLTNTARLALAGVLTAILAVSLAVLGGANVAWAGNDLRLRPYPYPYPYQYEYGKRPICPGRDRGTPRPCMAR